MLCALTSFLVRYLRWYWLLAQAGTPPQRVTGFFAYLSGFAFTATPGKVGELLRIRYFQPMGVSPAIVLSAFVFERAFDLVVVLCLAGIAASSTELFLLMLGFVLAVLSVLGVLVKSPKRITHWAHYLQQRGMLRLARFAEVFSRGFAHTAVWFTPLDVVVALAAGFAAWSLIAYAFVLLAEYLSLGVPGLVAFSLYPTAMLAVAASMLPG